MMFWWHQIHRRIVRLIVLVEEKGKEKDKCDLSED